MHWSRRLLIVLVLAMLTATSWPIAAQGGRLAADLVREHMDAAAQGQPPRADDLYRLLRTRGLSELEANRAIEDINRAYEREQNMSGVADWDFGPVFRDRDYPVTMPVENNCRLPQSFTITYPTGIMLDGPTTVEVPPKSKVDVQMMLTMTQPPMPSGPFPAGLSLNCYDLSDTLTLVHPEEKITTARSEYVCHEMTRTLTISMYVHAHGSPDPADPPGGGGGSGGGGPQGTDKTCEIYWNSNDFFATPALRDPEQCLDEIRALAVEFFGPMLESRRASEPAAWDWVPTADEIGQLSVAELKALKARADELAAPRYLP